MMYRLLVLRVLAILALLPVSNLAGQAGDSYRVAATPELPRFTLREIVMGSNDSVSRIPGTWLGAAMAARPDSTALADYHRVAALSGVSPLDRTGLGSERFQHIMGLYRRQELIEATRRTLAAIRDTIPDDTTVARFDRLFRPRGEWVVDLHDAALAWAQSRSSALTWDSARRALTAVHWLNSADSLEAEAVPRALYGLALLAVTDSIASARVDAVMWRADPRSTGAVRLLLTGYAQSGRWYANALGFFLTDAWIPDGADGGSLFDLVRDDWVRVAGDGAGQSLVVPRIETRFFGYPQAVPHYGVPSSLFQRLVVPQNGIAGAWLERHGEAGLLRTLHSLPAGDTSLVMLQAGPESARLTTVPRHSRESLNGFLEPGDVIAIDPGYSPLLAIGTVVHEWQHLLFRRRQLDLFAQSLERRLPLVELPGVEPYLAEGFAEWSSERILQGLHARWPLLALGELEKRAGLVTEGADDQHSVGYALVSALDKAVKDPATTTRLILENAEHPSRIAAIPALRRAWRKYRQSVDRISPVPPRRILIPEVTFTVEDCYPDVITTRIVVPPARESRR
jgi:hypothetical protein